MISILGQWTRQPTWQEYGCQYRNRRFLMQLKWESQPETLLVTSREN